MLNKTDLSVVAMDKRIKMLRIEMDRLCEVAALGVADPVNAEKSAALLPEVKNLLDLVFDTSLTGSAYPADRRNLLLLFERGQNLHQQVCQAKGMLDMRQLLTK